jgi:uncharacterized protein YgbK (DUF1537 family)
MMKLAIIADDLTGAADAAAPFAARGLSASVRWAHSRDAAGSSSSCDVCAWTTETRDVPSDRAAVVRETVRAATKALVDSAPDLYFKKIDSTLRGYLALELDAARSVLPGRIAVVCPAFVENGRVVQNGMLHVPGMPGMRVRDAFHMESDPSAVELSLADVRDAKLISRLKDLTTQPSQTLDAGIADLTERVAHQERQYEGNPIQTIFCDAETTADLDLIADAILAMPRSLLPVGSAGLAGALARAISKRFTTVPRRPFERNGNPDFRWLVVVGSRNDASRRQAAHLARCAGIEPIEISATKRPDELEQLVVSQLNRGARICLLQSPDAYIDAQSRPVRLSLARVAGAAPNLSLVVTGGATAMALISQDELWHRIDVDSEIEPGIVTGRLIGDSCEGRPLIELPIVLKAGGFGGGETLARCVGLAV